MSSARLLARIPAARSLGRGKLEGWRFVCNKRGNDGSAKANIMRRDGATVWGVVFRVSQAGIERLDEFEGGYERITVTVEMHTTSVSCATYASTLAIDGATPFDWYKRHIVAGAEEHRLPADYLAFLRTLPQRSPSD